MSVLSVEGIRRLSLGVREVDDVFPGFELGDFVVLYGGAAASMSFALTVRCQFPVARGGLACLCVFVDGGNMFSPYAVAETARECGLDYRKVLSRVYVSRAFTAYQFSSLIMEGLCSVLKKTKARLLVVSDVTSLFFDRDLSQTEARELFTNVCTTLSEVAAKRQIIVVATYFPEGRSRQSLFFEAVLFGKCTVLVRLRRKGKLLNFILEKHPHVKPFDMDFIVDAASSAAVMEA
jgi:hypothetical protein